MIYISHSKPEANMQTFKKKGEFRIKSSFDSF